MSNVLAIITARGGSKRIPQKNIKEFCSQPIIKYSIDAALQANIFNEIMVSTDDIEIACIAEKFDAKVPFMRSEKNSDDYATTADVIREVIFEYKNRQQFFDYICCIYPTVPFIKAKKLKEAYEILKTSDKETVVPVVKYNSSIQRALKIEDGLLKYIYPEYINKRSQDLESAYYDCGQFYFFKTEAFLKNNTLFSSKTIALELSELEVQDINTNEDWKLAEIKYEILQKINKKNIKSYLG
jgi:pseudaminic acid cytidylyltransferase